ncbi:MULTISPECIES: hypothetical protein [Loigolactobacillus]|uniref:hypothetical protein n=1 Tax=Loigolactobacillus TaxID=2767889 RepID=UPI0007F157A3|nr:MULTISPECIES: hypothetical protein [Loigolactobacillus]ANK60521.1 hypothetical protein AYR52_09825 [Loigolactobacillus backii]ANK65472.1 hypothetical protein AYR54_09625 [Loigolactobacillus backii]ANK67946.1 hypothetical protein AYR55_09755 [Loigolactobacillus backii]MDA5387886.1 hypothetical protein [Loigolactobacillus backii]MDA5390378.1 hypothetical protein [Loigolactobacillus backii]
MLHSSRMAIGAWVNTLIILLVGAIKPQQLTNSGMWSSLFAVSFFYLIVIIANQKKWGHWLLMLMEVISGLIILEFMFTSLTQYAGFWRVCSILLAVLLLGHLYAAFRALRQDMKAK